MPKINVKSNSTGSYDTKTKTQASYTLKKKPKTLSAVFKKFAETTTAHGFMHIISHGRLTIRVFWVLAIIGCQIGLWFQIKPLLDQYAKRPTQSKIRLQQESVLAFPQVTICNTNMITGFMIPELDSQVSFTDTNYLTNYTEMTNETTGFGTWYGLEEDNTEFQEDKEEMNLQKKNFEIYRRMADMALSNEDDVHRFGHSFNEMFEKCRWKGIYDCKNKTKWKQTWHWKYGNCFTFNSRYNNKGKKQKIFHVSSTGMDNGLHLTLNIQQSQYHEMTPTAAIIMNIGDQGQHADLYSNSYHLGPGYTHYVSLRKKIVRRADPFKNNSCVQDEYTDLGIRSNGERYLEKYTSSLCRETCIARETIRLCNCTSYTSPSLDSNRTCKLKDSKCTNSVAQLVRRKSLKCLEKCNLPCQETSYEVQLSEQKFKSSVTQISMDDKVNIRIFFQTFESQIIEEEEFYQIANLLGDIGGQLGLWSGFSVLTVVEFLFFVFYLAAALFNKYFAEN